MHRTHMPSVAAPAVAQEARPPRPTNDTAPVTPRQGAAIERARAHQLSGAAASGAGIAGMAGPAGPARPEETPAERTAGRSSTKGIARNITESIFRRHCGPKLPAKGPTP